ncbi:MAG: serine hydrolase [Elusimicrobia bacterium]|nr:serine hydrolase [Elusimicrobiota bacterium]
MRDGLLSVLSWSPSPRQGLPLAALAVALPGLYALMAPGGILSTRAVPAEPRLPAPAAGMRSPVDPGAPAEASMGAPPSAAPAANDPFRASFDAMTGELEKAAAVQRWRTGLYIKDLQRGYEWSYHADDLFPAASLIKLPIMVGVFEKIQRGQLSLYSKLKLRRTTRMGGSGSLKWSRDGTAYTVRYLLEKLIKESDNTAMMLLLDEVGIGFLQQFFPQMGLVYTEINPDGLRLSSGFVRSENYTTAREMGTLLERIYRGEVVNGFASELMLDILKRKRARSRLAKHLPPGWQIAHKTGLLRRSCHDAAIVFSPNGDYVLVTLTGRVDSYPTAKEFIARLGKTTYKHYRGDDGLWAKAGGGLAR